MPTHSGSAFGFPQQIANGSERHGRGGAMWSSRLRHVAAAAAALAAKFGGGGPHQLNGVEALCQIRGDADHDTCLTVAVDADDRDNPGADAKLCFVSERFKIVHRNSRYHPGKVFNSGYFFQRLRACRGSSAHCQFSAHLAQFAVKFPAILDETRQAVGRVFLGSL